MTSLILAFGECKISNIQKTKIIISYFKKYLSKLCVVRQGDGEETIKINLLISF